MTFLWQLCSSIYSNGITSAYTSRDAQLYLVNNSFFAHFVWRSILAVIDHMQEHTFPDFSCFPHFSMFSRFSRWVTTLLITKHQTKLQNSKNACKNDHETEKYLFVMCIHTKVNNVGSKTGKTVFTVRPCTERLSIGIELVQFVQGCLKQIPVNLHTSNHHCTTDIITVIPTTLEFTVL